MSIRAFKFRGQAFAPTGNVSVLATFNGVEIHNGAIPTTQSTAPDANAEMLELWTAEMDATVTGNINLSIEVQGGTLFFGGLLANSPYNPPDWWAPPYTVNEETDGKNNVAINGVPAYSRIPTPDPNTDGEWQYPIPSGSTFTCTVTINPPPNS